MKIDRNKHQDKLEIEDNKQENKEDSKEIIKNLPKIPKTCIECHTSTDFNFSCRVCQFVKCRKCAMQDIRITRVKLPIYFCKVCFKVEKKKTIDCTKDMTKTKRTRSKEFTQKNGSATQTTQTTLVLDKDNTNDLEKPSGNIVSTRKTYTRSRINTWQVELRKSARTKNKLSEIELNAINCHQCRTIKLTSQIRTCSNPKCCESYCFRCIGKYLNRLSSKEEVKNWICYKCKKKCRCKMCNFGSSNSVSKRRKRRKVLTSLSRPRKTTHAHRNIISIPMTNSCEKNVIKVDDFIIVEELNKDSHAENSEEEKSNKSEGSNKKSNKSNSSEQSENISPAKVSVDSIEFLEQKIINDKIICSRLTNASNNVENFYSKKYGNTILKKRCRGCNVNSFFSNDLLRFKNFSELLHYLKYSFIFKWELLKCDTEVFDLNKRHLFSYYDKFFMKKEEIYKEPATMCKFCFMQFLNRPNYLEEIKRIFEDNQSKEPICVNVAVGGKEMNITIINNFKESKDSKEVSQFDDKVSETFNDKPLNGSTAFKENPFFIINNKIITILDDLSVLVRGLNQRTKQLGCISLNQQIYKAINLKVDELRSLVSSLFPFISEHKEFLSKILGNFCLIYKNNDFKVNEWLKKEINDMYYKLVQIVEENDFYCGKYMEFIRTIASVCYNLLLQLNNQIATQGVMHAINQKNRIGNSLNKF